MSVRMASHAGSWYPSDANELKKLLDRLLGGASVVSSQIALRAIVAPHGGYRYSGQTAAWSYKSLNRAVVKRVFILGPCHHVYVDGCALPAAEITHYSTPLGDLELDLAVIHQLRTLAGMKTFTLENDLEEHSIEMQLPFLKYMLGSVKIVPIYVGSIAQNEESVFGQYLSNYIDNPETLFVISSDFCHWGHRFRFTPQAAPAAASAPLVYPLLSANGKIEALDRVGMDLIVAQDVHGFFKYCQSTGNTICGKNGLLILMETLRQAKNRCDINFVHYSQSGLLPQEPTREDSCVSYAAGLCVQVVRTE